MAANSSPLRILQLTDTHLFADAQGKLLGMETLHSLTEVIKLVQADQRLYDLTLVTGDLAQDGTVAAYERLKDTLTRLPMPSYWLAGNHDLPSNMAKACKNSPLLSKRIQHQGWQILLLDTHAPGKVNGELSQDELRFLDQALEDTANMHNIVCMHHHPISMQCPWIDKIGVRNADALFEVLNRHHNVRALLWGHVHQELDEIQQGIRMLSTPSTCVQFTPKHPEFKVDRSAPGYRWLELYEDGAINTGVSRVEHIEFKIDYSVKGY